MFENRDLAQPMTMGGLSTKRETLTERLSREKVAIENRLAEVTATLKLLEENPQVQQVFDQLSKINLY